MIRFFWPLLLAAMASAGDLSYELAGYITPAGRASVTLFGATSPFTISSLTNDEGAFEFHQLEPGTYSVAVFFPDRGEARRTLEVGPSTADSRHRVTVTLEFQDADFSLADALHRHTVTTRQLAVPEKAMRDYEDARQALARRDVESAVRSLEQAVEIAPQFADAWNELGTIAYQTQKFDRAEQCFREALQLDPRAYEPLVNLGGVLVTLNRPDEALSYNIYAVLIRPNDALAQSQLGLSYFEARNYGLALKHLEAARRLDPAHFSHPQLTMAEIHLQRGDRRAAADDLEDFLKYHPDWPTAAKMREKIVQFRQ
jgi:tetratricopeptide (TPR) repeat protein